MKMMVNNTLPEQSQLMLPTAKKATLGKDVTHKNHSHQHKPFPDK